MVGYWKILRECFHNWNQITSIEALDYLSVCPSEKGVIEYNFWKVIPTMGLTGFNSQNLVNSILLACFIDL